MASTGNSTKVGASEETAVLVARNARLLELVAMNASHPNAANRKANDTLLRELEHNLKQLESSVQGGKKVCFKTVQRMQESTPTRGASLL
jgi:hypothetical protein